MQSWETDAGGPAHHCWEGLLSFGHRALWGFHRSLKVSTCFGMILCWAVFQIVFLSDQFLLEDAVMDCLAFRFLCLLFMLSALILWIKYTFIFTDKERNDFI